MIQQPTFLYIEDDPLSREVMAMLLQSLGYSQLTMFEDSVDFLARIEALPAAPDVFFLDIHMKPHNGFEMLTTLRAHPTYASKIVIAITASVMNEEVAQLREAGFNGAIGKPLDFDNFAPLMEHVLNGEAVWHIT
jgi:two-component system cell cycle response regulator DivK